MLVEQVVSRNNQSRDHRELAEDVFEASSGGVAFGFFFPLFESRR